MVNGGNVSRDPPTPRASPLVTALGQLYCVAKEKRYWTYVQTYEKSRAMASMRIFNAV